MSGGFLQLPGLCVGSLAEAPTHGLSIMVIVTRPRKFKRTAQRPPPPDGQAAKEFAVMS